MLEWLNEPRVLMGVILGFVAGGGIFFVVSLISSMFPGIDKKRIKDKDTLLKKLTAADYTVYMPMVMESQLRLLTPLTSDEMTILGIEHMLIFDKQGRPITSLVPLATNSDQEAKYRRGQFKVVSGGKQA